MERDPSVITAKVKQKEDEFIDLHTRMDNDYDYHWNLDTDFPTPLGRKKARVKRDTDIEIVTNFSRTFAEKVQAVLAAAEMQIIVRMAEQEGEDKRDDVGKLERLFHFGFEKADERLRRMLLPPLRDQLIWFGTIRGYRAGRFLVYKDNQNNVIFDFMPLDPRWLTYATGSRGLLWAAYKYFRSKESLQDEHGAENIPKINNNEVIDWWENDKENGIINAVVCNNTFLKEPKPVNIPSMPILISPAYTRPPLTSSTTTKSQVTSEIEGYGESIFAPNRELTKVINDLASIWATHANLLAKQPLVNYRKKSGVTLKSTAYMAEAVLNLPMDENKLDTVPMKEISPTLVNLMGWLNAQRQQGALPDIEFGELKDFPLSGTAINELQEARDKVYGAQVRGLNNFYADICRLMEEQLIAGKLPITVETLEKDKYFKTKVTPVDLKKPHIIKVEFTARTPWTQLDTYQIADMAKRLGLPDAFIQEHILKLPDPKGLGDLAAIELFENSPKGALLKAWKGLMARGREDEAAQLVRDLYNMEMQEQQVVGGAGI